MEEYFEKLLDAVLNSKSDLEIKVQTVTFGRRRNADDPNAIPIYTPIGFDLTAPTYPVKQPQNFTTYIGADPPSWPIDGVGGQSLGCAKAEERKKCTIHILNERDQDVTDTFNLLEKEHTSNHSVHEFARWTNQFTPRDLGDYSIVVTNNCKTDRKAVYRFSVIA